MFPRRLFTLASVSVSLAYVVSFAADIQSNGSSHEFRWRPADGNPAAQDFNSWRSSNQAKFDIKLRKRDGSGKVVRPRVLDPKTFHNTRSYVSELPGGVRKTPTFVRFLLSATANNAPGDGTVLDIDGAKIGFQLVQGNPNMAEVMVATYSKPRDQLIWVPVGVSMPIEDESFLTRPVPLAVELNSAENSWSLYLQDLRIAEGLPLRPESGTPHVKIRAGSAAGDMAVLSEIALRSPPKSRGAHVKVVNGRLNLEEAYKDGNVGVRLGKKQSDQAK